MSSVLPWHQPLWQRLVKQQAEGRLPHAMLFAGAKGVGKVQFAEAIGARLLCHLPLDGEMGWLAAAANPVS